MKKGSITVFLSLVLLLLFSFLLTTLEAARIRGATAYVSMLSELAGDSFLASYYYPLFQNYRLFGVNMGNEEGYLSESAIADSLKDNIIFGTEGLSGGLMQFQGVGVTDLKYETLLSGGGKEFLSQVRQQTVLDGLSLVLSELFSEKQFVEAGMVGEVYREQEKALAVTATVTSELLKLMELVDGIQMGKGGIAFDKNGKMQKKEFFIKQLIPMEKEAIIVAYNNAEVFQTISGGFFRADWVAAKIGLLVSDANRQADTILRSENLIREQESCRKELEKSYEAEKKRLAGEKEPDTTYLTELEKEIVKLDVAIEKEKEALTIYEEHRDNTIAQAKTKYNELKSNMKNVQSLLKDALEIVENLEKKQALAGIAVGAYEKFLEGVKNSLSEELYQVFLDELEKMKFYAGLDEKGFSVKTMKQSLLANQVLLEELSLSGFSERTLSVVAKEMTEIKNRMSGYTTEGLWFSYGDITVAEDTWDNVTGFLSNLLKTGILSLVGISKEEQSERSLSGKDLPSSGLEKENFLEELMDCIDEVQVMFRDGGIGKVLQSAGNAALDDTALELYSMKYFHSYGEEAPYTKLNYEREYLIFGKEEDKSNLFSVVLYLVAIRTLFSMAMILKQPDRMSQLETLSVGVAGFTGIPVLAAVVKYGVLLLWSVEEALVEVHALLQGKRVAVLGMGTVSFGELFLMNKAAIERKARQIPDSVGAAYGDYLSLISLTRGVEKKAYRAMDLIQENIRFRYNDSFRIRHVVTSLSFGVGMELNKLFDTGVFPPAVYKVECSKKYTY